MTGMLVSPDRLINEPGQPTCLILSQCQLTVQEPEIRFKTGTSLPLEI